MLGGFRASVCAAEARLFLKNKIFFFNFFLEERSDLGGGGRARAPCGAWKSLPLQQTLPASPSPLRFLPFERPPTRSQMAIPV